MQEKRGRRVPVAHNQGAVLTCRFGRAICMPPACRTGAVAENPCLAPDEAFLRSPEGGIETTESGRAEKRPSKKAAELQEANGGDWGRLGADRDRGTEIDTDRNTDRERDIDRGRKHRNHW